MAKLWEFPLEPYALRYTLQWQRWFRDEFNRLLPDRWERVPSTALTSTIEHGEVLDAIGTNYWKMCQMANFLEHVSAGHVGREDVLFFADLWYPGLEALFYVRDILGVNWPIVGILHAGTYDIHDFTHRYGMHRWGRHLERCWLSEINLVFVGSSWHKRMLMDAFSDLIFPEKVVVTGLPFMWEEVAEVAEGQERDIDVLFPHRLDPEKQPGLLDRLVQDLGEGVVCARTMDCWDGTKESYYKFLGRGKVAISYALQETFGYAMLEATAAGCVPIVPDGLSYLDNFPARYRFRDYAESAQMVLSALNDELPVPTRSLFVHQLAISRMVEELKARRWL